MMTLVKTSANSHTLQIGFKEVYFSYETPIGFHTGTRCVVRQNDWSTTTGKHLNAIDGGNALAKHDRYPGDEFERMLKAEFNL